MGKLVVTICPFDGAAWLTMKCRTLTGIPIAGQILTANKGDYWGLIVFTGMCYVGGFAAFLAARVVAVGWKFTKVY